MTCGERISKKAYLVTITVFLLPGSHEVGENINRLWKFICLLILSAQINKVYVIFRSIPILVFLKKYI